MAIKLRLRGIVEREEIQTTNLKCKCNGFRSAFATQPKLFCRKKNHTDSGEGADDSHSVLSRMFEKFILLSS